MSNSSGPNPLVIERILRDRAGIWRQINEQRDLRGLATQTLTTTMISLAIFGLVLGFSDGLPQALSSMVKLPLLFLATLAICLPTLYLFNLVFGARLSIGQTVTLIMVAITVIAVLTLAFAPISLFFLITAQNYSFFKLLNVCILMLTAFVGLRFLTGGMAALNTRHEPARTAAAPVVAAATDPAAQPAERELALVGARSGEVAANGSDGGPAATAITAPVDPPRPAPARAAPATDGSPSTPPSTPPSTSPDARSTSMALVYIWILLFGFVGTQLAWTLRPFFGDPNSQFALFREISGTFYSDILQTIGNLLG